MFCHDVSPPAYTASPRFLIPPPLKRLYPARPAAQGRKENDTQEHASDQAAKMVLPGEAGIIDVEDHVAQQPEEPLTYHCVASRAERATIDYKESSCCAEDARDCS